LQYSCYFNILLKTMLTLLQPLQIVEEIMVKSFSNFVKNETTQNIQTKKPLDSVSPRFNTFSELK
jgi:hypothetical protein